MQNAGLQYGEGVTPTQESPFGSTSVQNNTSSSTSSLRQFRKKENVDKQIGVIGGLSAANAGAESGTSSHVARVAPHNHYPHKQNEFFRYPAQYQDYSSPYKEHTVKYSEIAEPVIQSIPQLDHLPPSVLTKHKEKDYVDMCNIPQQTHINKPYSEHQFNGQQSYSAEMALHHQYMHKDPQGPQMHSPYKPESQYIPKEGAFNHQIPPFLKYNIPQSRNYGPLENSSLTPFQRMDPHIARSIMTDHHHMRDFSSEYGPMEQSRIYAQKQRYYAAPLPTANSTYPPNYPHRNIPAQQYNYPSCNYPRSAQMNSSMGRYPINMDRSISPRRTYPENIDMSMNFGPVPQKMTAGYPNYPAYAQHYQQRRPTTVPQEYYHAQQHPHTRPHPQYMPTHHPQEVTENHVASNNIRQYLENWAEEEPGTELPAQIENSKYISRLNRDETNEVYVINASELPQYLENGVPLVTSENGQYIFKSNVSIDNTGAIKILEKANDTAVVPADTQERVVSLHIIENPNNSNNVAPNIAPEHGVCGNQATPASLNVIATGTNHPNVENHSFNLPQTAFTTNRTNLVHQVSPASQNVTPNYNNSVNSTPNQSVMPATTHPALQVARSVSKTVETNIASSPHPQVVEKPTEHAIKTQCNTNTEGITSDRLKIQVLSYNEVPQNSCIISPPQTQNRLNFDESLLPNPVPCDSKEMKNDFEDRNCDDNHSNEHILTEGHEELDKIVEDTLTSTLESCDGSRLMKIDEKRNTDISVEENGHSRIPDDLNLDLESNPKDLTSLSDYPIGGICVESKRDLNEDIIDLSTSSRRGSGSDAIDSVQVDVPQQINDIPSKTQDQSIKSDLTSEKDMGDQAEVNLSLTNHMPLIYDNLETEASVEIVKTSEAIKTENNVTEIEKNLVNPQTESIISSSPEREDLTSKSRTEDEILTNNEDIDLVLEKKLSALVGEPIPIIEKDECEDKVSEKKNCEGSEEKCEISKEKCEISNEKCEIPEEKCEISEKKCEISEEKCEISGENCEIPEEKTEDHSMLIPTTTIDTKERERLAIEEQKNDNKIGEVSDTSSKILNGTEIEDKKERIKRKRFFSVDDIIYRIGSSSCQNQSKSPNCLGEQDSITQLCSEEPKTDTEHNKNKESEIGDKRDEITDKHVEQGEKDTDSTKPDEIVLQNEEQNKEENVSINTETTENLCNVEIEITNNAECPENKIEPEEIKTPTEEIEVIETVNHLTASENIVSIDRTSEFISSVESQNEKLSNSELNKSCVEEESKMMDEEMSDSHEIEQGTNSKRKHDEIEENESDSDLKKTKIEMENSGETESASDILKIANSCRFSVIQKTEDSAKMLQNSNSYQDSENIISEEVTAIETSDIVEASVEIKQDEYLPEPANEKQVVSSDVFLEPPEEQVLPKKPSSNSKMKKIEATFEQRFVEPLFSNQSNEETTGEIEDVEEKLTPEDVQYRSILKIEETSVLLEIGGELVEVSVNHVNGKKVITVVPLSNTTTVDFNDNYERDTISEEIEDTDVMNQIDHQTSVVEKEASDKNSEEENEPVLIKIASSEDEDNANRNEEISSTQIETLEDEDIFEDVIENEIIIGDESLEEEINLDLKNIESPKEDSSKDKPVLYTKAAKKLYDDVPIKTYTSLREFRRIKIKPESSSKNENSSDARKCGKRSIRSSSRPRSISEHKEGSQVALQELIKRRKMRKEKIRLKFSQYAKNESVSREINKSAMSVDCSSVGEKDETTSVDVTKMENRVSVCSMVKKVKTTEELKNDESKEKVRDKAKKKYNAANGESSSVEAKNNSSSLDIEKNKSEEKPSSTSVFLPVADPVSPTKNFHNARPTPNHAISKHSLQDRNTKFPKMSAPRDLTLTKSVNEHYLSRKDHSNLKKKLSIQEYNSRKRKSDVGQISPLEKNAKTSGTDEEVSSKKEVQNEDNIQGKPSIYLEKQFEYTPNSLKDPRIRPSFVSPEQTRRPQSEDSNLWQTPSISSSRPVALSQPSQPNPASTFSDSLLNSKHSYNKQIENYRRYKTSMLEKSSMEKSVPRSAKISGRRKTIEVMNQRKYEPREDRKSVTFDDNVQINEIHTTQTKVVKIKVESSPHCEVSSSCSDLLEECDLFEDKTVSYDNISRLNTVEKNDNDWESSNSPKDSITDAFADNFLEKNKFENLTNNKNKNKLIIDINDFDTSQIDNELRSPPMGCSKNTGAHQDEGSLKNYKEEVDSKLNSLNIQIPKTTKTRSISEDDILVHKFLRKEQLNSEEIKQIRRIIYLKKKIQQLAQQNLSSNPKNVDDESFKVKKNCENFAEPDLKLQLKKMEGKPKRKKKRFRNLYSRSPETVENEVQESAGEFSVYEENNLSGVKLIFKRKTDLLHLQPVVKLERCSHIESMARKLHFE